MRFRIQHLNSNCNRAMNLMRSVSSTGWRADLRTIMMIYTKLIRYKVDYCCIVYSSANCTALSSIVSAVNKAMGIASGCFKSAPKTSLQVITEACPLWIRRDKLRLRHYCYMISFVNTLSSTVYPRTRNILKWKKKLPLHLQSE